MRAAGAKAFFFIGDTTTPLTVYEESDEDTPHPHPVVADANGRWPEVHIPFIDEYDVQVTTSGGTQLYYFTEINNPDPVEASVDSVADEELLRTGDCFFRFVDTTLTGCVRLNGRTIGNAASGGTERANADTSDLFAHLWNNLADGQAAVSTGRGASAAADYAANKTIALPDLRGAIPLGLDDMGNSAASRLGGGGITFGHGDAITPGSLASDNTHTLTTAQLATHLHTAGTLAGPAHTHTVTTGNSNESLSHTHAAVQGSFIDGTPTAFTSPGGSGAVAGTASDATTAATDLTTHTHSGTTASSGTGSVTGSTANNGSGSAHNSVQRSLLVTWFIKL